MSWHKDKRVNQALIGLMDALCEWERNTGRGSKLVLIWDQFDEWDENIFLLDGKPVNHTPFLLKHQLEAMAEKIE